MVTASLLGALDPLCRVNVDAKQKYIYHLFGKNCNENLSFFLA